IGKGLYSVLIIIGTFGLKGIQQTIKKLLLFYFISFSVGGGLFGLHFLIQDSLNQRTDKLLLYVNNIYGDLISLFVILLCFQLISLFTRGLMDRHAKDKIK